MLPNTEELENARQSRDPVFSYHQPLIDDALDARLRALLSGITVSIVWKCLIAGVEMR